MKRGTSASHGYHCGSLSTGSQRGPGAIGYADLGDSANGSAIILEISLNVPAPPLIGKGIHQFWTIEHIYTTRQPDRDDYS